MVSAYQIEPVSCTLLIPGRLGEILSQKCGRAIRSAFMRGFTIKEPIPRFVHLLAWLGQADHHVPLAALLSHGLSRPKSVRSLFQAPSLKRLRFPIAFQVFEDRSDGIKPWGAHHPATWMRARSTQIEVAYRSPILGPPGHRSQEKELI